MAKTTKATGQFKLVGEVRGVLCETVVSSSGRRTRGDVMLFDSEAEALKHAKTMREREAASGNTYPPFDLQPVAV